MATRELESPSMTVEHDLAIFRRHLGSAFESVASSYAGDVLPEDYFLSNGESGEDPFVHISALAEQVSWELDNAGYRPTRREIVQGMAGFAVEIAREVIDAEDRTEEEVARIQARSLMAAQLIGIRLITGEVQVSEGVYAKTRWASRPVRDEIAMLFREKMGNNSATR